MSTHLPVEDIAFIAEFATFCRAKGDATYFWAFPNACALAQFGYPEADDDPKVPPSAYRAAVIQTGPSDVPESFSALADRLEALIADAPKVELAR